MSKNSSIDDLAFYISNCCISSCRDLNYYLQNRREILLYRQHTEVWCRHFTRKSRSDLEQFTKKMLKNIAATSQTFENGYLYRNHFRWYLTGLRDTFPESCTFFQLVGYKNIPPKALAQFKGLGWQMAFIFQVKSFP